MAKTTYKHKAKHAEVGVVDAAGAVHDPLVFDPECTVDDDDQAYAPTIRVLLADGDIQIVEAKKPTRKAT